MMVTSGMVRGTVAFALVAYFSGSVHSITVQEDDQVELITTSVLFLIIGSNLIIGLLMPFFASFCFARME